MQSQGIQAMSTKILKKKYSIRRRIGGREGVNLLKHLYTNLFACPTKTCIKVAKKDMSSFRHQNDKKQTNFFAVWTSR